MPFRITLEEEKGKVLSEVWEAGTDLVSLLPDHEDRSFQCLRFVNEHADAVFNELQMPTLIEELSRIGEKATEDSQKDLLHRIKELAEACRKGAWLFLKFYGE